MHLTRQRRHGLGIRQRLFGTRASRRARILVAGTTALAVLSGGIAYASTTWLGTHRVGETIGQGLVLPSDQAIDPIGDRLVLNDGKIMSSTVSPDGSHLAAAVTDGGKVLSIVNLETGKVQQTIAASRGGQATDVGQEGPTYSPDGQQLWLGQINGYTKYTVNGEGSVSDPVRVPIPADGPRRALASAAVFSSDGSTVYSAVNGQNRVVAISAATGAIQQSWDVGIAPRDMVLVGDKLYVSNEGGRRARPDDTTLNSYNTDVPADLVTGASTTGTVSVIDVADVAAAVKSIEVGLHPTAMHAADGAVFVTDTNSDDVSVIDTSSDEVVQTIATQPWPSADVGYHPNGVTLTDDGHLLVTLGRANALAVYRYTAPQEPVSYVGLLPMDYYPANVDVVGDEVLVTNMRGIGARGPERTIAKGPGTDPATGHNTHASTGTLQRFTLPDDATIEDYTDRVFHQNGWDDTSVEERTGGNVAPVPVPRRLGDPSTIKYVYLIVKENRTYDQQFGDMPRGNGDPSMTQFGEDVTPNQHALARQFGLYDNTYDVGTNSAEGHNWLMQADDPEYTESTAGEYQRSYGTGNDALGHQRSGFIWTGAQAAGKTARVFGEYLPFGARPADTTWQDYYCDAKQMAETGQGPNLDVTSSSPIPSQNDITVHAYPRYDMGIPDQYRYQIWKRDFDANGPANLNLMVLPVNHTGGARNPHPIAQVADNDLALGKVIDTISHSKYWNQTAIFVVEDDTQNGVDHVDGGRGPVQIISPWAKRGVVDSHYYTQITMIRTIEQILGIQPMNQKDAAATPMRRAFTQAADYTPYNSVDNRIPLTYGLDSLPDCGEDTVADKYRSLAPAQSPPAIPADKQEVANLWKAWERRQRFSGENAMPDYANPEQMDHFTWYETHGWRVPYPGEHKIFTPAQVPGAYLPAPDYDG